MVKILSLLILLFFLPGVFAMCSEGQIDINTASLAELENLSGIGPVKAQNITDARPFSSIDDLIRVSGIGNATLNKIKTQGLACVDVEDEEERETQEEEDTEDGLEEDVEETSEEEILEEDGLGSAKQLTSAVRGKTVELETINLSPKAIKSEENSSLTENKNGAFYGLIAFVVLLGILFLIKDLTGKRKKNGLI